MLNVMYFKYAVICLFLFIMLKVLKVKLVSNPLIPLQNPESISLNMRSVKKSSLTPYFEKDSMMSTKLLPHKTSLTTYIFLALTLLKNECSNFALTKIFDNINFNIQPAFIESIQCHNIHRFIIVKVEFE